MADATPSTEKRTAPLNLRFTPSLKKAFKVWCAQNDTDMSDEIEFHVSRLISGKAKAAPKPKKSRK